MRISKLVGKRVKETPSSASLKSHILLLRAGFIKQVGTGIFSLLPPAQRVSQKIQNIIREEMNNIGGQEVLFPVVMPRELWDMSGRYSSIKDEMVRFKDRTGHDMLLGMTHEEAAVHMMLNTATSHEDLPCMIYQIQTKFRDEARPRGGLIRVREFTMKDAYSFHTNQEDLEDYYKKVFDAYVRIYKRIGFKNFISVKSDTGMMGGKVADEFMAVTEAGEDKLVICPHCNYSSNMEVANSIKDESDHNVAGKMEEVFTGNAKTIEEVAAFLEIDAKHSCKAVCYQTLDEKLVVAFIRGDCDINETKLSKLCQSELYPVDVEERGLFAGNIGCVNINLPEGSFVFFDKTLEGLENFVTGANKKDFHIKNVSISRDVKPEKFEDFSNVREGDLCCECHSPLTLNRGIEIGNIFQLGTKYTKTMGMKINMPDGTTKEPIMGCYGIGVGRSLASIIEEKADEKGMVWPITIAPWQVYLCPIRIEDENVSTITEELYKTMQTEGIEVLFDDRNVSAGVKLTDSELMGIPVRVVISPKTIANGQAEITIRSSGEKTFIEISELINEIKAIIKFEKEEIEKDI
ncbi:MAG: proline--tRNA ligase [Clostridiales bacterium]|nr:proline--tRNA ligase [Clostridiales bacterium]